MKKTKIFADSTCDLNPNLIEQYDITIIPEYVTFGDDVYKDGIDINTEELYKKVEALNQLPKTAAPSPADFESAFRPFIEEGKDIIFIGLSSKISATIQNALLAASEFEAGEIEIIDSMNLSSGTGLLVLEAAEMSKDGFSIKEIAEHIRALVPKIRTYFIIDTLDYLHKGGRCSGLQSFVGGMLKIRPLVKMIDGNLILGQKTRGKRSKALSSLVKNTVMDKEIIDKDRIMITHSYAHEDIEFLKSQLESEINPTEIIVNEAGCVISSHCGKKTIGILYLTK